MTSSESAEGEQTIVRSRPSELYSIEIWREGVRQTVVPVTQSEVTIGRGSRSVTVDLPLKGDPEVSRIHATLARDESGQYWLTPKGRNPTLIAGREIPRDERSPVSPDDKIDICSFSLRIQPK
jgi:pSer/pThr/pTyr-binding forkhead associated (FHA) protein